MKRYRLMKEKVLSFRVDGTCNEALTSYLYGFSSTFQMSNNKNLLSVPKHILTCAKMAISSKYLANEMPAFWRSL